jgi:hypothetical protein
MMGEGDLESSRFGISFGLTGTALPTCCPSGSAGRGAVGGGDKGANSLPLLIEWCRLDMIEGPEADDGEIGGLGSIALIPRMDETVTLVDGRPSEDIDIDVSAIVCSPDEMARCGVVNGWAVVSGGREARTMNVGRPVGISSWDRTGWKGP